MDSLSPLASELKKAFLSTFPEWDDFMQAGVRVGGTGNGQDELGIRVPSPSGECSLEVHVAPSSIRVSCGGYARSFRIHGPVTPALAVQQAMQLCKTLVEETLVIVHSRTGQVKAVPVRDGAFALGRDDVGARSWRGTMDQGVVLSTRTR